MAFENVRPHTVPVTTVADVAALKALPAGSQGDQVYVADQTCFVVYQADSTLAEDQPNGIFVPDSAPPSGRWIYQDQSPVGGGGAEETEISPTALASDTDDWNPTDWGAATVVRIDASADVELRGLAAPTSSDVIRKTLINVSSANTITMMNEAGTSTAGNRIITSPGSGFDLLPDDAVEVLYDSTSSRWRTV